MGIIDVDRGARRVAAGQLDPSGNALQFFQFRGCGFGVVAGSERQGQGAQGIRSLKTADQGQRHLGPLAGHLELQPTPVSQGFDGH